MRIGDFYEYAGLFGGISHNAIVENLILDNVKIVNSQKNGEVGAIAGNVSYESVVRNCEVRSGTVKSKNAGGVVGTVNLSGKVYNCVNMAEVNGTNAGGIFYSLALSVNYTDSLVYGCFNYGKVQGTRNCGGIGAELNLNTILKNCVNYGDVVGGSSVGGIIGYTYGNASITSCANYGSLTDSIGGRIGGILGSCISSNDVITIMYCSSVGLWSGFTSGTNYIYGGTANGLISGCYVRAILESSVGSGALVMHKYAYGTAEDFNKGFRFVSDMNNNLPMQVDLFEYASQITMQSDVLSTGLAGFQLVG